MGYTNVAHYPEGKQGWMEAGPTAPVCDFVDSGTCKVGGERDFGQLRRLADRQYEISIPV
jgi:hypothetical protein